VVDGLGARINTLSEQAARLFAADCAERVLPIANDKKCDAAVLASRRYAFGLIGDEERDDAAKLVAAGFGLEYERAVAWAAVDALKGNALGAALNAAWARGAYEFYGFLDQSEQILRLWTDARANPMLVKHFNDNRVRDARSAGDAAEEAEDRWQRNRLYQYLNGEVDLDAIRASVEVS
jgi:hypothetical protein